MTGACRPTFWGRPRFKDSLLNFMTISMDFRGCKPVEFPRDHFTFDSVMMKISKIATSLFSEPRRRKTNVRNSNFEKFLLRVKKLSIPNGDPYLRIFEAQDQSASMAARTRGIRYGSHHPPPGPFSSGLKQF